MLKTDQILPMREGKFDLAGWMDKQCSMLDASQRNTIATIATFLENSATPHPLGVSTFAYSFLLADILLQVKVDFHSILAALLSEAYLQGRCTDDFITEKAGVEVLALLKSVKKLLTAAGRDTVQKDLLRKMLLALMDDVRVVFILLARRVGDLRLYVHQPESAERKAIAKQTQELYAPLAHRLGIGQWKWELEDLSFRILEPAAYKHIAELLHEKRQHREAYVADVVQKITALLEAEGIHAQVVGRPKHLYSIWRKMIRKKVEFSQIYDVRAFRVLVESVKDCYAGLGLIHGLWQPVPNEFDDYIASPKENGYRSLHTAVIGPEGCPLEVQLRTVQMHQEAELGVAAHWLYKEGGQAEVQYQEKLASLRQILDWQLQLGSIGENDELLKGEVFADRVYVFTPKGSVIDLPVGSTPLDFAYHIHTDLGHRCRGAKVNGAMVTLQHVLKSGDQVEILATKQGEPSRDWLNTELGYLNSTRARAKVHNWFRQQDNTHHLIQGKELADKALKRLGLSHHEWAKLLPKTPYKTLDEFYIALGSGDTRLEKWLLLLSPKEEVEPKIESFVKPASGKPLGGVQVAGLSGTIKSVFAHCCNPVPGEPILGYMTLNRGITIHKADCIQALQHLQTYDTRQIEVSWQLTGQSKYPVDIVVNAYDRQGLLKDITGVLSSCEVNILGVNSHTDPKNNVAHFKITLQIDHLGRLEKVLQLLNQLTNVLEAYRVKA